MCSSDLAGGKKTCLVLWGGLRPYFPREILGIKVSRKTSKLVFLHATAWSGLVDGKNKKAAEYKINYADGSTETIDLVVGKNIGEWWSASDLPEAVVGCKYSQPSGEVIGLYNYVWDNPHPEKIITTIDFVSAQTGPVAICAAITGVN